MAKKDDKAAGLGQLESTAAGPDGKPAPGLAYAELTDRDGQPYRVTSPAELFNLTGQGYALPEGVAIDDAAAHLAPNVGGEPAASTAAAGSGGAGSGTGTGAAATASAGGGSGTSSTTTGAS